MTQYYNNNVFLPEDTKPIVQTHIFCTTMQVDKNIQNRMFYNGIGGWITRLENKFNRTCCNGVGSRTTGLQTHS